MPLNANILFHTLFTYCFTMQSGTSTVNDWQQDPTLTIDAIITSLDTTAAYILIKARSANDQRPLTILSERDSSKHILSKGKASHLVQTGHRYTFRLQTTTVFKTTAPGRAPEYDILNFVEFWIGNLRILDANEMPYMALNMQGYRIEQ